ncbi:MAG TPA: hypothetical protein VEG33_14375 [Streptosporangiaceae bacterium]|nr:hypothetical protein [Streptosporangiaceae bacterium]
MAGRVRPAGHDLIVWNRAPISATWSGTSARGDRAHSPGPPGCRRAASAAAAAYVTRWRRARPPRCGPGRRAGPAGC